MSKKCVSCGMPLSRPADFPLGDPSRDWCVHCGDAVTGELKPWEQVLDGMTAFLVRGQGLDGEVARKMAAEMLSTLPAWRDRPST